MAAAEQTLKNPQKKEFQTEAKQLLNLMVHSLYTHREVFLRELISNASDALDKIRFESLTRKEILDADTELAIRLKPDKNAKTLTISDNGIGMTYDEVVENIGTIARSGSKAFLEKMTGDQKADSNLIGQFGVGFYSVFMVASKVTLETKKAGSDDPAVVWESDGTSEYAISESEKSDHGTTITVYLKDDAAEFVEDWQIRSIVKKYSDFIAFPIYLPNDKGKDEVINETKPIWKRSPSDITEEQYEEFFKQALGGVDTPLSILHNRAEGVLEYASLLYIPEKAPFDLFMPERKHGVKLYVKRVFVMDDCKELMPSYLRFIKGVVDSEDLPLNVSREVLQNNPVVVKIQKALVNRVLGRLQEMADTRPDDYKKFWEQFGPVVKEGLHTDFENADKLKELLRFQTSAGTTPDELVSLKQYVGRMQAEQKEIYYITGENRDIVEKSPHLEIFREKNIEVLYLLDPIDEFVINSLYNYDGKQLKSVTKGDLDLGDMGGEEQKETKKAASQFKKLNERIKNILSENVKDVRATTRLKDSPCCLVVDEKDMGAHMEKIMRAMGQQVPESKRILEVNVTHPILKNLKTLYDKDAKAPQLEQWVRLLYNQALIAEGQQIKDAREYTKLVSDLLSDASARAAGENANGS